MNFIIKFNISHLNFISKCQKNSLTSQNKYSHFSGGGAMCETFNIMILSVNVFICDKKDANFVSKFTVLLRKLNFSSLVKLEPTQCDKILMIVSHKINPQKLSFLEFRMIYGLFGIFFWFYFFFSSTVLNISFLIVMMEFQRKLKEQEDDDRLP
jgi:hypothetical protein